MRQTLTFIALFFFVGCVFIYHASAGSIRTEAAYSVDDGGTYTLILYGGRYYRDAESLALLDLEDDSYTLEPYAPEFDYRVIKGLTAKDALGKAEHFLSSQYAFRRSLLSRILDSSGKTIGYELRPLYYPLTFGITDVLDVGYALKNDGKVRVYIRLDPAVVRHIYGGGGPRDGDN